MAALDRCAGENVAQKADLAALRDRADILETENANHIREINRLANHVEALDAQLAALRDGCNVIPGKDRGHFTPGRWPVECDDEPWLDLQAGRIREGEKQ